jgi:hypothetical protein
MHGFQSFPDRAIRVPSYDAGVTLKHLQSLLKK